ncbi:hypothetical protein QTP88_009396 [Uroleucon formosanum]
MCIVILQIAKLPFRNSNKNKHRMVVTHASRASHQNIFDKYAFLFHGHLFIVSIIIILIIILPMVLARYRYAFIVNEFTDFKKLCITIMTPQGCWKNNMLLNYFPFIHIYKKIIHIRKQHVRWPNCKTSCPGEQIISLKICKHLYVFILE